MPKLDIHRVVVDGKRYYKYNGKLHQSVTERLSDGEFDDMEDWMMSRVNAGASKGQFVHDAMEDYVLMRPIRETPAIYKKMVRPLMRMADEHLSTVYAVEHMMASNVLGIAGTADLIGLWDNKVSIIDWKTSENGPWDETLVKYRKQGTCYGVMARECHGLMVEKIVIAGVMGSGETFLKTYDAVYP